MAHHHHRPGRHHSRPGRRLDRDAALRAQPTAAYPGGGAAGHRGRAGIGFGPVGAQLPQRILHLFADDQQQLAHGPRRVGTLLQAGSRPPIGPALRGLQLQQGLQRGARSRQFTDRCARNQPGQREHAWHLLFMQELRQPAPVERPRDGGV